MRRVTAILLAIFLVLTLAACDEISDEEHDRILQEISASNREKHKKREAFLSSEVYQTAYDYVSSALNEMLPECEKDISLEPGSLLGADLSEFADFAENEETRLSFFSRANLYLFVNFWDYDMDGYELAAQLTARQISCELAADEYGANSYIIDAATGKTEWVPEPGV